MNVCLLLFKSKSAEKILSFENMQLSSEESMYRAIVAWVKHDLETRVPLFDQFFSMLDLDAVSKCHLSETVAKEVRQIKQTYNKVFITVFFCERKFQFASEGSYVREFSNIGY